MRSFGSVFAGIVANFLAVPIDAVMHAQGIFPPEGQEMSEGLFGLAHAMILGGGGLFLSSGGAVAMWKVGPAWYPLALIAICLPASWAGARLFMSRRVGVGARLPARPLLRSPSEVAGILDRPARDAGPLWSGRPALRAVKPAASGAARD